MCDTHFLIWDINYWIIRNKYLTCCIYTGCMDTWITIIKEYGRGTSSCIVHSNPKLTHSHYEPSAPGEGPVHWYGFPMICNVCVCVEAKPAVPPPLPDKHCGVSANTIKHFLITWSHVVSAAACLPSAPPTEETCMSHTHGERGGSRWGKERHDVQEKLAAI